MIPVVLIVAAVLYFRARVEQEQATPVEKTVAAPPVSVSPSPVARPAPKEIFHTAPPPAPPTAPKPKPAPAPLPVGTVVANPNPNLNKINATSYVAGNGAIVSLPFQYGRDPQLPRGAIIGGNCNPQGGSVGGIGFHELFI